MHKNELIVSSYEKGMLGLKKIENPNPKSENTTVIYFYVFFPLNTNLKSKLPKKFKIRF